MVTRNGVPVGELRPIARLRRCRRRARGVPGCSHGRRGAIPPRRRQRDRPATITAWLSATPAGCSTHRSSSTSSRWTPTASTPTGRHGHPARGVGGWASHGRRPRPSAARRQDRLQRVEAMFDPLPFDGNAVACVRPGLRRGGERRSQRERRSCRQFAHRRDRTCERVARVYAQRRRLPLAQWACRGRRVVVRSTCAMDRSR